MDILWTIVTILFGIFVLLLIISPILAKFTNKYDEWECFNKQTELPKQKLHTNSYKISI